MSCGTGKQAYVQLPLLCQTYNTPVKSTPVTVEGSTSSVLTFGVVAGSGAGDDLPQCPLQTTH